MRAHYLQHVSFEGLGSIESWLLENGYEITCTRFFENEDLPKPEEIDLLIIMGGPMSVNDEMQYPWLPDEKKFIAAAIKADVSTLGICLGAQLIASAMGQPVYPNSVKEIGWFPISATSVVDPDTFSFKKVVEVFHWHGETFDLPDEALLLAESKGCKNQAFQIGSNVIGLQFHLETTPQSARLLVEHCRNELSTGEFIQTEKEILFSSKERYQTINRLMTEILDYLQ